MDCDTSLPNSPVPTDEELQRILQLINDQVDAAEHLDRGVHDGYVFDWAEDGEDNEDDEDGSSSSTDPFDFDDSTTCVDSDEEYDSDNESIDSGETDMMDPEVEQELETNHIILAMNGPSVSLNARTATRPRTFVREIYGLGFDNLDRFLDFVHRREIRAIFQELWGDFLSRMPPTWELPTGHDRYRCLSNGIRQCWANPGNQHQAENPDKTNWHLNDHMMRFAMQLGPLCNGAMMGLSNNRHSILWAWAAMELVRVLRRMQKGFSGRSLYLQAVRARREGRTVRWAV